MEHVIIMLKFQGSFEYRAELEKKPPLFLQSLLDHYDPQTVLYASGIIARFTGDYSKVQESNNIYGPELDISGGGEMYLAAKKLVSEVPELAEYFQVINDRLQYQEYIPESVRQELKVVSDEVSDIDA